MRDIISASRRASAPHLHAYTAAVKLKLSTPPPPVSGSLLEALMAASKAGCALAAPRKESKPEFCESLKRGKVDPDDGQGVRLRKAKD